MYCSRDKLATIAAFGKIENAKIAKKNNVKFPVEFCSIAAECGQVEMLKWAIDNGIPLSDDVWVRLEDASTEYNEITPKVISDLISEWTRKKQ